MRQFSAIGLVLILMLPLLAKVGVVSNYIIQYDRYAYQLCENKENSEMGCNGKCQMMKELKRVDSPETKAPALPGLLKTKDLQFALQQSCSSELTAKEIVPHVFPDLIIPIATGILSDIFQPPRV